MALNKSISMLGWGGTGLNDYLKELSSKLALGVNLSNVVAKGTTDVHAALAGTAAVAFPGPITNPAMPRNIRAVFAASYDGGNLTITGTDQFGNTQTETIVAAAASTVVGVKVWKTITSIVKAAVGVNAATVSIGTGDKLGLGLLPGSTFYILTVNGVAEAGTLDEANGGITPTTVPNGTADYNVLVVPKA